MAPREGVEAQLDSGPADVHASPGLGIIPFAFPPPPPLFGSVFVPPDKSRSICGVGGSVFVAGRGDAIRDKVRA